jgi:hypothetical protein
MGFSSPLMLAKSSQLALLKKTLRHGSSPAKKPWRSFAV